MAQCQKTWKIGRTSSLSRIGEMSRAAKGWLRRHPSYPYVTVGMIFLFVALRLMVDYVLFLMLSDLERSSTSPSQAMASQLALRKLSSVPFRKSLKNHSLPTALAGAQVDGRSESRTDKKEDVKVKALPANGNIAPVLDNLQVDEISPNSTSRHTSYIVVNEPRSGSSWLQEISQMHPGIMVQFELNLNDGDAALECTRSEGRRNIPDSKHPERIPPKAQPPLACGMTTFGSDNDPRELAALAARHDARLVLLLRRNHVAHAVSLYRHFNHSDRGGGGGDGANNETITWTPDEFLHRVGRSWAKYSLLLSLAAQAGRPTHLIWYEDLAKDPAAVWAGLQRFLGLPLVTVPGIETLEARASDRPALAYLEDLPALRASAGRRQWHRMAEDVDFDAHVDFVDQFWKVCLVFRRVPAAAGWSWRGGTCGEALAGTGGVGGDASS